MIENHRKYFLLVSCLALAALIQLQNGKAWAVPQGDPYAAGSDAWTKRREASAQEIIAGFRGYLDKGDRLHQKFQTEIAQAQKLQGEAHLLENTAPTTNLKLSKVQLKAALEQYNNHVNAFKLHANDYYTDLRRFGAQLGECHANQAAYEAYAKKYQLHTEEFHLPAIRPPHVCGLMDLTTADAQHMNGQLRADATRLAEAQGELVNTVQKLRNSEAVGTALDASARLQAQREQREVELTAAFGRLKEEYDLLKSEKDILSKSGSTVTVARGTVSGKIKSQGK